MRAISRFFKRLGRSTSGNALMIVAAGVPALIGGAGFAVDMSQWYMWKSELQYATDQAAIAGAYARTSEETEAAYQTRAQQEYTSNLSKTASFATAASVSLAKWAGGKAVPGTETTVENSVVVTASATKSLPFSSFLTGSATTVRVRSQASFEEGVTYNSCLVAVDPDASGAVTIGGSAEFVAGCGIAALSNAEEAITVKGNPTIDAGWLISAGGIDDWFDDPNNSNDTVIENQTEMKDPFAELSPPDNPTPRTASCPKGKTTTTTTTTSTYIADKIVTRTQITYGYYKKSGNNYVTTTYTGQYKKTNVDTSATQTNVTLSALPSSSTIVTGPTVSDYDWIDGSGNAKVYQRSTTTTTVTYTNAHKVDNTSTTTTQEPPPTSTLVLEPGTYSDMTFTCDVVYKSGVYVIDGGSLTVHAQYNQTGSGVMFVLKNGAGIQINGGASINLTAMGVTQLEAAGVTHDEAVKLAGILIFEDRNSRGTDKNKINGNSATILNGAVYLPVSNLDIAGSAGVTDQCLRLVASTITLSGNMSMNSFCPPDTTPDEENAELSTRDRVRLVS